MTLIPQPAVAALTSGAREQFLRSLLTNPVTNLTSDQAMAQLAAPIPLVWGRRDATDDPEGEVGGVWVAPLATELRFENDDSTITAYYQLVLSQGQVGAIQSGELWQGAQQRGTVQQAYSGRAGTWTAGNALQQRYRFETITYQATLSAEPWTGWNSTARRAYTFEEFDQYIRAKITLTSRGNYVTAFNVQPVKSNIIQPFGGIDESYQTSIYFQTQSGRYLPGYNYTANPSPTENRFSVTLQEEGIDYVLTLFGGKPFYQPPANYVLQITETNAIPLPLPAVANYCGTGGGSYYGLSTASVSCTYPNGSTDWRQQAWVFLRGGAEASRLIDTGTGPSPWLPDLARYLMLATDRVTADQIDTDSLTLAARFNRAMGLRFNGEIRTAVNLRDFLGRIAPLFLLEVQDRGGRLGLVPAHPVNASYRLDTEPITPLLTLNESHIVPGSFQPRWIGAAERQATALIITYRAQPANQPAYDRVIEVRAEGSGEAGPFEPLDLREFCCSYRHALVVGLWRQARRNYVTHRLRGLQILPEYDSTLRNLLVGSVIQVNYPRVPSYGEPSVHSYLYAVEAIRTDANGQTTLDLEHFPVDHDGRSLVALDVMGRLPTVQPQRLRVEGQLLAPIIGSGVLIQPETLRVVGSINAMTSATVITPPQRQVIGVLNQLYENLAYPYDLFLQFNGANGSTSFSDSGTNYLSVTTVSQSGQSPSISTAVTYNGEPTGLFVGNGYLSIPSSTIDLAGNNFEVSALVYPNAVSANQVIVGIWPGAGSWRLMLVGNVVQFWYRIGSTDTNISTSGIITAQTWQKVQAIRTGSQLEIKVNDTQVATATISGSINSPSSAVNVGRNEESNVWHFNGHLKNVLINTP
jgi:hypothetical protein